METIEQEVEHAMRGVGCYQAPDQTWTARVGMFSTLRGCGATRELAIKSLGRKVKRLINWRRRVKATL